MAMGDHYCWGPEKRMPGTAKECKECRHKYYLRYRNKLIKDKRKPPSFNRGRILSLEEMVEVLRKNDYFVQKITF